MEPRDDIKRIAVIGAGQMGSGIAQVLAMAGRAVSLCDVDEARALAARAKIAAALERAARKGKLTAEDAEHALNRIAATSFSAALGGADFAIEAATEDPDVKGKLFARIDTELPKDAIIASNTSSIPIARLAASTQRPALVIGMHFMNPVPVMKLVEIVLGAQTSQDTHRTVRALAEQLGKTVVVSQDRPGFIVNRILIPLLNEACSALQEGVASAEDIDTGARLGLNHPMGPLELADLIGLDTVLAISEVMRKDMADDKYEPPQLLRKLVAEGKLGRKTGQGFYAYGEEGNRI